MPSWGRTLASAAHILAIFASLYFTMQHGLENHSTSVSEADLAQFQGWLLCQLLAPVREYLLFAVSIRACRLYCIHQKLCRADADSLPRHLDLSWCTQMYAPKCAPKCSHTKALQLWCVLHDCCCFDISKLYLCRRQCCHLCKG